MPTGFYVRKEIVYQKIAQLPTDEKECAYKMYAVLDKIEWLTVAPFVFGMFFMILAIPIDNKLFGEGVSPLLAFGVVAILYVLGVILLKNFIFNPFRAKKLNALQKMASSDCKFKETLETLERIDPDMSRNIGGCVKRTFKAVR